MIEPITYRRRMKTKDLYYKFHPTENLLDSKDYKNIRKVRCLALTDTNLVCMVSNDKASYWMMPGGTIEKNENPILALKRELQEEADIEIRNYKLMGFLEFEVRNKITGYVSRHAEMIFTAKVAKISEQTEDPANGFIMQRDFFDLEEMAFKIMRWGRISKYFVEYIQKNYK